MSERQNWWNGLFLSKSSGIVKPVKYGGGRQDKQTDRSIDEGRAYVEIRYFLIQCDRIVYNQVHGQNRKGRCTPLSASRNPARQPPAADIFHRRGLPCVHRFDVSLVPKTCRWHMGLLPDAQHVHMIAVPSNRDGLRLAIGEAWALIGNGERGLEIFSGENSGDRHRRDYQEARENRQALSQNQWIKYGVPGICGYSKEDAGNPGLSQNQWIKYGVPGIVAGIPDHIPEEVLKPQSCHLAWRTRFSGLEQKREPLFLGSRLLVVISCPDTSGLRHWRLLHPAT